MLLLYFALVESFLIDRGIEQTDRQTDTHFLWLSVRVIPCEDTLKCTTVEEGDASEFRRSVAAFCIAW